jgi:hypothetical protein
MKSVLILDTALVVNDSTYQPFNSGLKSQVFVKWPPNQSPDAAEVKSDIMIGYVCKFYKLASALKQIFVFIKYHFNQELAIKQSSVSGLYEKLNIKLVARCNHRPLQSS